MSNRSVYLVHRESNITYCCKCSYFNRPLFKNLIGACNSDILLQVRHWLGLSSRLHINWKQT